jgi:hypothetical protein
MRASRGYRLTGENVTRYDRGLIVINVACPHCGARQDIPADWLGTMVDCPGCNAPFEAEDRSGPRREYAPARSRRNRRRGGGSALPPPFRWGAIGAAGCGAVGLFLSQFAPVFGGLFGHMAGPFSEIRIRLIPIHLFVFGVVGLVLGVGGYFAREASTGRR